MRLRRAFLPGQTAVIMTLVIATLVGAISLGADVGVLYYSWVQLQKAADSAVLAGANYLTGVPATTDNSQVVSATNQYAQLNGVNSGEIVSTTVAGDAKSVTIVVQRTVPYFFARVLGLSQGVVSATATAAIKDTIAPMGMLPIGLPCTQAQAKAGSDCDGLYKQYSQGGGIYNLNTKFPLGATGSWGKLALGGSGMPTFENNIIYGYNGSALNVGDMVSPETGNAGQPTVAAFDTRMSNAGESWSSANATPPSTLSAADPQVVLVPMVDFTGGHGASQQFPITGFAEMYVVKVAKSGNDVEIDAYFLQPLANNGIASTNPCSFGSGAVSIVNGQVKINSCTPVLVQ